MTSSTATKPTVAPAAHSRRRVLATLAATGAAAATATACLPAAHGAIAPAVPATGHAPQRNAGYALTDHVQRYYALARF